MYTADLDGGGGAGWKEGLPGPLDQEVGHVSPPRVSWGNVGHVSTPVYPGETTSTTALQRSIPEELAFLGTVPFPSLCLGQGLTRPGAVWVWLKGPRDQAGDWGAGCPGPWPAPCWAPLG